MPVRLVRGLGYIALADESGLVRYPGERTTTLVGLGLLSMIPLAAAFVLAWELTWLATLLLGGVFIGLPALAFVDAGRAGRQRTSAPERMPACAPTLQLDGPAALALQAGSRTGERQPTAVLSGAATALGPSISPPLPGAACLAFRLDIRAGRSPELVARYTAASELAITCADGTRAVITGTVELTAPAYQAVEASHRAYFELHGTRLLPALFTHGGWACQIAVRHGDAIQVHGPLSDERRPAPLGSSYRQSGALDVLRGTPANPVVITLL